MSKQTGRSARHAAPVTSKKGVFVVGGITVAAVGVAFAIAAPLSAFGSPVGATDAASVRASVSTSPSGRVILSAAGLHALLNARLAPAGAAVTQQGPAAAQQTTSLLSAGSGTTSGNGAVVTVKVPAIAGIAPAVQASLDPVSTQMDALSGSNGQVASAVKSRVLGINSLLNLAGPHGKVTASVPIDLDAAVAPELSHTAAAGAVTVDPRAGTVSVDLTKLLSAGATGTDGSQNGSTTGSASATTLSPAANAEITADLNSALSSLGNNVVSSASDSVESTPVNVNASLSLETQPAATSSSTCTPTTMATPGSSATTGAGGLLGGVGDTVNNLLGGQVGTTVTGTVNSVLCSLPTNLLPGLLTTVALNQGGTVGQIIDGSAPAATGSVSVLGQPTSFDGSGISDGVGQALVNNFDGAATNGGTVGSGTGGTGGGTTGTGTSGSGPSTSGTTTGTGSGASGGGTNTGQCTNGSAVLSLCVGVNANTGSGNSTGAGVTAGILGSLNSGGATVPAAISAVVGSGDASTPTGSSSGSGNLLNVRARTHNDGLGARVNVGTSSSTTGSESGLLGLVGLLGN